MVPLFVFRQEWRDSEEGIETVLLHWVTTRLEQEPNWRRSHHMTVMVPQLATYPALRSCPLWVMPPLPRQQLLARDSPGPRFLLHSFCEVVQRGRTWTTETTSQAIASANVTHSDHSGEYTHACLYYSLDRLASVNRAPMVLQGLPARYQPTPATPESEANGTEYGVSARRSQLIARLPLPHLFHGQIWGPVGTPALYSIYLNRRGMYNPFSEGGFWLLRDGNPWEVQL